MCISKFLILVASKWDRFGTKYYRQITTVLPMYRWFIQGFLSDGNADLNFWPDRYTFLFLATVYLLRKESRRLRHSFQTMTTSKFSIHCAYVLGLHKTLAYTIPIDNNQMCSCTMWNVLSFYSYEKKARGSLVQPTSDKNKSRISSIR